ncbi:hypothetical protein I3760_13G037700 [Carya illinoinensis]|nr:hypothetical protein I3760_13G037700 [Carya illinoinensis]
MSCMLQFLNHDLILPENQVPWMVLERLFCMTMELRDQKSLMQLAKEFFANIFSSLQPRSRPAADRAILQDRAYSRPDTQCS